MKKSLKDKRILLTRPNNTILRSKLEQAGAKVLEIPLINIDFTANKEDTLDVFEGLGSYEWITFASVNGVNGFFKEFFKAFEDIRSLGIARIACVGEITASELRKYFIKADVIAKKNTSMSMIEDMVEFESLDNLKILNICSNLSDKNFAKELEDKYMAIVDSYQVYKTSLVKLNKEDKTLQDFKKYGADAVLFASPSALEAFLKNAEALSLEESAIHPKIVSIGESTSKAIKKLEMNCATQADSPSSEDVFEAILKLLS